MRIRTGRRRSGCSWRTGALGLLGAVGLLGALAVPAGAAAAPQRTGTTSYSFTSAAGDYIGGGRTAAYRAPADRIGIGGSAQNLRLSVSSGSDASDGWSVELAAPRGDKLRPGIYRDAERAAFRTGRSPGLDVSGNGRGCNEVYGQFAVNQIETDANGAVTLLDATFTQKCERADAAPLKGTVKYRAHPLSYRYTSDPGDYIGAGGSASYTGSTSTFALRGAVDGIVDHSVSGKRDHWSVRLAAPAGERLVQGRTYRANRMGDDGAAQLDATGNGRGCNRSSGEFTVTGLVADDAGTIEALAVTFVQHCEGAAPALRGTIRYFA